MQSEAVLIAQTVGGDAKTGSLRTEGRTWSRLFGSKYQWSGINGLLYYGPTLMHLLGLQGGAVALMVSGGIGIVQFLAVLLAIVLIDRVSDSEAPPSQRSAF